MTVVWRPFSCEFCGHKMRFSGTRCSYCHTRRPLYQQGALYVALVSLLFLGGVALVLF